MFGNHILQNIFFCAQQKKLKLMLFKLIMNILGGHCLFKMFCIIIFCMTIQHIIQSSHYCNVRLNDSNAFTLNQSIKLMNL